MRDLRRWLMILERSATTDALLKIMGASVLTDGHVVKESLTAGVVTPMGTRSDLVEKAHHSFEIMDMSKSRFGTTHEVPKPGDSIMIAVDPGHPLQHMDWYTVTLANVTV